MVQPVITVAMYWVVFVIIFPNRTGYASGGVEGVPYILFLTAGLVPWFYFSAEEIYERVWNETAYSVENTIMVHIRRIREKIEINPNEPRYLKVVWGIGYKMEKIQPQRGL